MKLSLLILPFQNLSASPEEEYISDGITEELIQSLSRLDHIQIASRTSSFYFKQKERSLTDIREMLDVSHVLEGSVRRQDSRIRITVHLIDAVSGFTQWSETYKRKYEDLLELEEEIAACITQRFFATSLPVLTFPSRPRKAIHGDSKAYDAYLKGLYYHNQYTMEMIAKGSVFFEEAIRIQPDFALAHSGLCDGLLALGGYIHPSYFARAKEHALKALSLNPNLLETNLSMAMVHLFYDRDWEASATYIQRALELNIRSADVHRIKGIHAMITGQVQQGIDSHEIATKYDPLNTIYYKGLGWALSFARKYPEAEVEYERALTLDPGFRPSLESIGWLRAYESRWEEAIDYFTRYQQAVGDPLKGWMSLGYAYGKTDQRDKAYEVLQKLSERKSQYPREALDFDYALVYLGLGQLDKVFTCLNKALEKRHIITLASLVSDPIFDEIRSDERFQALMQVLNLPYQPALASPVPADRPILTLQSETREQLQLFADQLLYIEADGNYSRVVWKEQTQIRERLLRLSLAGARQQITVPEVIQSHRSYLVNLSHFHTLIRKDRQYQLIQTEHNIEVPVSRQLGEVVKKQFQEISRARD